MQAGAHPVGGSEQVSQRDTFLVAVVGLGAVQVQACQTAVKPASPVSTTWRVMASPTGALR